MFVLDRVKICVAQDTVDEKLMEYNEHWHAMCNVNNAAASCGQKKTNMNRITQRDPIQAIGKTKQLFELVRTELGVVVNLFHFLGVSDANDTLLRSSGLLRPTPNGPNQT
jgi:hypothetical protein